MSFLDIAKPMIERNVPVIPLRPKEKIALLNNWPELATTDLEQIKQWNLQYPDANCGCVCKPDGIWIWEVDSPEVLPRFEKETGKTLPKTFRVRSRIGRGHMYWKSTAASTAMGNLSQNAVKFGDWSARVDNQYCVSANSLHPVSGLPYEIVSLAEIAEAPEFLVEWLIRQRVDSQKQFEINETDTIVEGSRNSALASIAGKARQNLSMDAEELENFLLSINRKRCQPPLSDSEVKIIANSISRYPVKPVSEVPFFGSQKNISSAVFTQRVVPNAPAEELEEQPTFTVVGHPKFPTWVMNQTSLFEGFAKPYCAVNSRIDYFMWMSAFALLLNYVGTKVNVYMKDIIPSIFMVIIGRRGETMKSASVQDAVTYFKNMGLMDHAGPGTKTAEGKSLVWTAGSPEGLGIDVQRTNCRNITLLYDELSMLTSKAGIDSSGLVSALLTMYESAKFSNKIKAGKESYSIDPGTYCATLIACSTDKNFLPNWSKLSGDSTGLDDRFFFLYQPETFKEPIPQITVSVHEGALETRKLIDLAIKQGTFRITDDSPLAHKMKSRTIDNREGIRVVKFALGFAIDMGKQEIDEECIERALALIKYEKDVKKYLAPFEASSIQGSIQMELITLLKKNSGKITVREMNRSMHPERMGTDIWARAYGGLVQMGYIKPMGTGTRSDPQTVVLMRAPEEDDN